MSAGKLKTESATVEHEYHVWVQIPPGAAALHPNE